MNNNSNPFEPKIIENVDNNKSSNVNNNLTESNNLASQNVNNNVSINDVQMNSIPEIDVLLSSKSSEQVMSNSEDNNVDNLNSVVENNNTSEINNELKTNTTIIEESQQTINNQVVNLENNHNLQQDNIKGDSAVSKDNDTISSQITDKENKQVPDNKMLNYNKHSSSVSHNNLFNNVLDQSSSTNTYLQFETSNNNAKIDKKSDLTKDSIDIQKNNIYNSSPVDNVKENHYNTPGEQSKLQQLLNSPNKMANNITSDISFYNKNNMVNSNSIYNQNNNYNKKNSGFINNNGNQNNSLITNDDLLENFIGKNYEKIMTRKFNFAGFFLSSIYMLYRKMFGYSILVLILNIIISIVSSVILKNELILIVLLLIVEFMIGFSINKMYISFARKKINAIKYENPQMNMQDVKNRCIKMGGTSIGIVIGGLIIHTIIAFLIILVLAFTIFKSQMKGIINLLGIKTDFMDGIDSSSGKYNGLIETDTQIVINNEYSITVPEKFINESSIYEYAYSYNEDDTCNLKFYAVKDRDDANKFINEIREYEINSNPSAVNTITINNINWNWVSYKDVFGEIFYYGTTKNDRLFLLKYRIMQGDLGKCDKFRDEIINSIKSN